MTPIEYFHCMNRVLDFALLCTQLSELAVEEYNEVDYKKWEGYSNYYLIRAMSMNTLYLRRN